MHERLVVPKVVGLRYITADWIARSARLELHNPDPDGPPVSAIAWEENLTITGQNPEPDTVLVRESVVPIGIRVWLANAESEPLAPLP